MSCPMALLSFFFPFSTGMCLLYDSVDDALFALALPSPYHSSTHVTLYTYTHRGVGPQVRSVFHRPIWNLFSK